MHEFVPSKPQDWPMNKLKIGIIREGKVPPDKRVPLSPAQCREVAEQFPTIDLVVQPSHIRKFKDEEYAAEGVRLQEDMSDRDVLIGVKEVPIDALIPQKTYLFFSHTFKLQPYNAKLLKAILNKKIRLIDYEVIKAPNGRRLIGFGRYAGVVGCYNGFRTYGLKHGLYDLKKAEFCEDRRELEAELQKVRLPRETKIVLTGFGRVGHGAREILALLPITEVKPDEFLNETFDAPVFTHLEANQYNARESDGGFDKREFYADPSGYKSTFLQYCQAADMYIACHYYAEGAPYLFTREDARNDDWRVSVVADISCDIDGPVASTIRPSTIADPIYGYNPLTELEVDFKQDGAIAVMAVDNLPCELPKDASADFGDELIKHVLPLLANGDQDQILLNATETTLDGTLMPHFSYLKEYALRG